MLSMERDAGIRLLLQLSDVIEKATPQQSPGINRLHGWNWIGGL